MPIWMKMFKVNLVKSVPPVGIHVINPLGNLDSCFPPLGSSFLCEHVVMELMVHYLSICLHSIAIRMVLCCCSFYLVRWPRAQSGASPSRTSERVNAFQDVSLIFVNSELSCSVHTTINICSLSKQSENSGV